MMVLPFFLLVLSVLLVTSSDTTENPSMTTQKQLPAIQKTTEAFSAVSESTDSAFSSTTIVPNTESSRTTVPCEGNDTECNNINVTTVSTVINDTKTNKTEGKDNKKQLTSKIETDRNICTCNLQVDFCDINCCCDPDCSPSDKTIFGYCEIDKNHFYDTRYCNYIKYIYVNNTPFQWEVNQDGLFCIISSNLPDTYLMQKEEPIGSIETVQLEKNFWSQENYFSESKFQFGLKNYVFGDSIMIIRDDASIDNFRLPKNFLTPTCIFDEDVYYLKDGKNTCSQMTIDKDNAKLNFSSFFKKCKVIGSPGLFNVTKLKGDFYKNCPKNICLDIIPKLCDIHFTNCSEVKDNTNITFHCSYNVKKNSNTCQNAVEKIHYNLYHNGTNGLHKVEVLGILKNFSYHFGRENYELFQDYSVKFMWTNQIENYSQVLSGNPGYIIGKPILVGLKISYENKTSLQRNSSSFLENFLVFPANIAGICVRNDTYNTPIEFGYNMITKCKLSTELKITNNQTATEICRSIQKTIFGFWGLQTGNKNISLVVGLFGNANASNIQDWTPVLYKIDPTDFLNSTQGNFTNKNEKLICQNISTFLETDVFYSRVDLKTILIQNKVLGITFNFMKVRNYSFTLNKKENLSRLDLSLDFVNQVSFYDITGEKTKKFVDPPSFDIRLPYDFFYPFIRVGNSVRLVRPNNVGIILFLYLSCLF